MGCNIIIIPAIQPMSLISEGLQLAQFPEPDLLSPPLGRVGQRMKDTVLDLTTVNSLYNEVILFFTEQLPQPEELEPTHAERAQNPPAPVWQALLYCVTHWFCWDVHISNNGDDEQRGLCMAVSLQSCCFRCSSARAPRASLIPHHGCSHRT